MLKKAVAHFYTEYMIAYSMGHSTHSLYMQSFLWLKVAVGNCPKKRTMHLIYNIAPLTSSGVKRTGQAFTLLWEHVWEPGGRKNFSFAARVMKRFITYSSNWRSPGNLRHKEKRWKREEETFNSFQVIRLEWTDEYWKLKRKKWNEMKSNHNTVTHLHLIFFFPFKNIRDISEFQPFSH